MTEIDVTALIQQMLQPSFYPHEVVEPVQLIQTHISYILLTGKYVYKLKKPMNFGFLDFSTLEKRQYFCREELRLNYRGAAELYIEVLPITQVGSNYQLYGTGKVVEYVLKMYQFPQENLLSSMFDTKTLEEKHLVELGEMLALYHKLAEMNDYIRSFGKVTQLRKAIDENYEQTEKYIGSLQTKVKFDETKAYSDRFFAERQELLDQRVQGNFIRECHGDLHLRNIALWQDKILMFDCIEFNESFRFVDVMYDVAFIVMDLEARHRQDLGNLFLNTYLEKTGDWEGLQVLPLYLSRQAYVRAKVTSFLLDDSQISAEAKEEASKTASNYYTQAWEYTKPHQGKLMIMSGLSGSGKSTTAHYLSRKLGAIQIRSDAVRKHLAGILLKSKGADEIYTSAMTQKTYRRLLDLGIILTRQGFSVILDAKYDLQALRQKVIQEAEENNIPLQIIQCEAPIEVIKQRLKNRNGDISDATVGLLNSQIENSEPLTKREKELLITVNTTQPLENQLTML